MAEGGMGAHAGGHLPRAHAGAHPDEVHLHQSVRVSAAPTRCWGGPLLGRAGGAGLSWWVLGHSPLSQYGGCWDVALQLGAGVQPSLLLGARSAAPLWVLGA